MVDRSINPAANAASAKAFWVQLVPKVAVHIVDNHKQKEQAKVQLVYGNGKKKNGHYTGLQQGFYGMERIGRPWRRVN